MATPKKSSKSPTKTPAKAAAAAESKSAAPAVQPAVTIDPGNAAHSVAAALAARARQTATAPVAASQGDSHAFKKFKEGMNKTQFSAGSPLAGGGKANKFGGSSSFAKQTGHNQTSGPSVARTGVPRRTSGG